MSQINPDPHAAGYTYHPTHAVTAFFPPGTDAQALQRALADAGFADDQVHVYTGQEAVARLDLQGDRHGGWVQFRRELERLFADETRIHDMAEGVLRSGGVAVVAYTGKDDDRKARAAEVLKSLGGLEVLYWGTWVIRGM
jgi:hypothetical protein